MKNKFSPIYALICFLVLSHLAQSQVAINTDGSDPDASSILDIKSTNKGILIPRMATTQRTTIAYPVKGLLVFDNDTNSFWFYDGSNWVALSSGTPFFEYDNVNKLVKPDATVSDFLNDDFVFGSPQLGDVGNSDHDRRFFFDKSKGAFQAGDVNIDQWDDANVGNFSVAFGKNTKASGKGAFALGRDASALGDYSFAAGDGVAANQQFSVAMGQNATANNFAAISIGDQTAANGFGSVALGRQNTAHSHLEIVLGSFATNYTPNDPLFFNANDRLLTIGNGTTNNSRSDAFMILKNGNTFINGALTLNNALTLPTTAGSNGQVLTSDGAGNATWQDNNIRVTHVENTTVETYTGASTGWQSTQFVTNSLSAVAGDLVVVQATFAAKLDAGTGTDALAFRLGMNDGATTVFGGETASLQNFEDSRNKFIQVSIQHTFTVSTTGNHTFSLYVDMTNADEDVMIDNVNISAIKF